ncbi:MAG: AAA family ATPase [Succinivibrionaceae bacterium]|nr:AAA family ATPase [Succinivibrionaceae bacterium]MEE1340227.1 AAA family ATPase [Succinivibrionaceae bacterium]
MNNIDLKNRISSLIYALNSGLFERKNTIKMCMLAALSGESVFMLGPPGIAKSLIARKFTSVFYDVNSFEYLMTRFSTTDEIFGPLSINALKNEGRYSRLTNSYLPKAQIVFLDEIWKAGPAILNSLLTVINEKIFKNGDTIEKIPMHLLITASNELPEQDSGLEALYDRMLIRLWLDPIKDKANFKSMLTLKSQNSTVSDRLKIKDEELLSWAKEIEEITISNEAFEDLYFLKEQFDQSASINKEEEETSKSTNVKEKMKTLSKLYISDRRWKKAYHLLATSAYFNERVKIEKIDLLLLKDIMWNDLHTRSRIYEIIKQYATTKLFDQSSVVFNIEELNIKLTRLTSKILNDIGIKMNLSRNRILKFRNKFYLNFNQNDLNEHQKQQKIIFLDECHLDPDNIDKKTVFAEINTSDLKKLSQRSCTVPVKLSKNTIVNITLGIDSHLNLISKGDNGKIIALTIARSKRLEKWRDAKWGEFLQEYTNAADQIDKDIIKIEKQFKSHSDHLFLSEDIMLDIATSINSLRAKHSLMQKHIENIQDEIAIIKEELIS